MLIAGIILGVGGVLAVVGYGYSKWLARVLGEDVSRPAPSVAFQDGRDYVPSPTPVVFAHHFASIAGAGPIVGPILGLLYGWVPAVIWLVLGGLFIGAVHDFSVMFVAMRERGQSIAVVARRTLGPWAYGLFVFLVITALVLVTATFLNLSATALTSMVSLEALHLEPGQSYFREQVSADGRVQAVVGGIASMSVIVITALAPLVGFLYLKRQVNVWACSLLAVGICIGSVWIGYRVPVAIDAELWKVLLAVYVLAATGLPVWLFLQSRDFINVHMLYVGLAVLLVALVGSAAANPRPDIPAVNIGPATALTGEWVWPFLFITIACGAVSGFHSLCASGTACKQLPNDAGARRVGYFAMLLETLLAVSVVCAVLVGLRYAEYGRIVFPGHFGGGTAAGNPVLAFGVAVGGALHTGLAVPMWLGVVGGMLLIEGFLVTTLDTAVRLNRYLFQELWALLFSRYRAFQGSEPAPGAAVEGLFALLKNPWFNAFLAVGLMLLLAAGNAAGVIWPIFGATNQLLAALGLLIVTAWLLHHGRSYWFVLVPGIAMFVTTFTALVLLLGKYAGERKWPLVVADGIAIVLTVGIAALFVSTFVRRRSAEAAAPSGPSCGR